MKKLLYVLLAMTVAFAMIGCPTDDNDGGKKGPVKTVTLVTVSPNPAVIQASGTTQFSAVVTGTNLTTADQSSVTWEVTAGTGATINASGLLTAGADVSGPLTVKATSTVDKSKSGTATVTVFDPATQALVTFYAAGLQGLTEPPANVETFLATLTPYAELTVVKNQSLGNTFPADPPNVTGYTFAGWGYYTEEDLFDPDFGFDVPPAEITSTTTIAENIIVLASWDKVIDPSTFVERVALENGASVVYKFVLPQGGKFSDYAALSFDVKLEYPESAGGEGITGSQQIQAVRLWGIYRDADFITKNPEGNADLNAYVARFEASASATSKLQGYIAGQKTGGWTWDYSSLLGDKNASEFFNIEFELNGADIPGQSAPTANNPTHADNVATNWATATDPGPFYFAIGISGNNGNPIVQSLKNIKLIAVPDSGVADLYSTGHGLDMPAFAAYVTSGTFAGDVGNAWRDEGDTTAAAPIYVLCDANGGAGGKTVWTFPNTQVTLPTPTRDAFLFTGWFTAATGGTEVTTTSFATKTTIYAQWEEDPDWTDAPAWDTLDNDLVISVDPGIWTWDNSTNQKGFFTKGAYNTGGTVVSGIDLEVADLKNAIYLVLDVDSFPVGGGSIVWQNATHSAWSGNSIFGNDGAAVADSGVQFVGEEGDDAKIVIQLSKAFNDYADFQATSWARFYIQLYQNVPENNSGPDALGVSSVYLLFADDYIIRTGLEEYDLDEVNWINSGNQWGWATVDADPNADNGGAFVEDVPLLDLAKFKAAKFLVLETEKKPTGGGGLVWGNQANGWRETQAADATATWNGVFDGDGNARAGIGVTVEGNDTDGYVITFEIAKAFKDAATDWATSTWIRFCFNVNWGENTARGPEDAFGTISKAYLMVTPE